MIKIFPLIFLCAATALSQMPDIKKLEPIGIETSDGQSVSYYMNARGATRKGSVVTFEGLVVLDADNYLTTVFRADCSNYNVEKLSKVGVWDDIEVSFKYRKPEVNKPDPSGMLFKALQTLCAPEVRLTAQLLL